MRNIFATTRTWFHWVSSDWLLRIVLTWNQTKICGEMLVEIFLVGIVEICDWQIWIRIFLSILQQIEAAAQLWEFHLGPMADKIEPCDEEAEAGEGDF